MENRYCWKPMPGYIGGSHFNYIDLRMGKKFIIIDTFTGITYPFPVYENKRDPVSGGIQKITAIPPELWNQEFFNWICKTSPDFCVNIPPVFLTSELVNICLANSSQPSFISEVHNLREEQAIEFVKRLPEAIKYTPVKFITEEMVLYCARCNYFNLRWISSVVNPNIIINVYNLLDYPEKVNFVMEVNNIDFFTSEVLEDLLINIEALKVKISNEFWKFLPKSIITPSIAKRMININWTNLKYIPEDILDEEMVTIAVRSSYRALLYVPDSLKTQEVCNIAFDKNVTSIKNIPDRYKTYDMCKKVAITKPLLIKYIPARILTPEFYEELISLGIVIPKNRMGYVKGCLEVHNYEFPNEEVEAPEKKDNDSPIDIRGVSFDDIKFFFSPRAIKHLMEMGITSLSQLFELGQSPEFATTIGKTALYSEISGTIRILRCKYLNEDPLVDMSSYDMDALDVYRAIGLSKRSSNCLIRTRYARNSKEFFDKLSLPTVEEDLGKLRNIGSASVFEIIQKANIVREYYTTRKGISNSNEAFILIELNTELKRLTEERAAIDAQIVAVQKRIKEYEAKKNKGVTL